MKYFKVSLESFNKKGKVIVDKPTYLSVNSDDIFSCLDTILFYMSESHMVFHPYANKEIENYRFACAHNLYEFKEKHIKNILCDAQRVLPVKKEDQYYIFYYDYEPGVSKEFLNYCKLNVKEIKFNLL